MKASELIKELELLTVEHGDLDICVEDWIYFRPDDPVFVRLSPDAASFIIS